MHMVDRALSMPSDRLLVNRLMFVWPPIVPAPSMPVAYHQHRIPSLLQ